MKRVIVVITILFAIWAAFFLASYFGLGRLANAAYNNCFDNAGKWYTSESAT